MNPWQKKTCEAVLIFIYKKKSESLPDSLTIKADTLALWVHGLWFGPLSGEDIPGFIC